MSTAVNAAPVVSATKPRRARITPAKRRQYGAAYALVLPFFIIFVAMVIVPLVYAGYLSLYRKRLIGGTSFAGAENYIRALTDPLFSTLYELNHMPQITSIQFWRRSGGTTTSERGEESKTPHLRAIRDGKGRIMVLMSFNTDIGDAWERETEDIEFFYKFAHDGYALGIDALLHVMSH